MTPPPSRSFLHVLSLSAPHGDAPAIEAALEAAGLPLAAWEDADSGFTRWEHYAPSLAAARRFREQLANLFPARRRHMSIRKLLQRDWATAWKRFFRTERISPRLVIKPSWETYRPRRGDLVIELDAGMSFGTGRHPTTRACLRFLDRLAIRRPGATFIDIGCGSGILAIAAARLGFRRVTGIDNDPIAVRAARDNARRNGVGRAVTCRGGDLARLPRGPRFDVVVANLFAKELLLYAPALAQTMSEPDGCLILSGLLRKQFPSIRRRYASLGLVPVRLQPAGEWMTAWMEWRPVNPPRKTRP